MSGYGSGARPEDEEFNFPPCLESSLPPEPARNPVGVRDTHDFRKGVARERDTKWLHALMLALPDLHDVESVIHAFNNDHKDYSR